MNKSNYLFKIATLSEEFEQIHQLNYETFVEEIPQHEKNNKRRLIDSYHDQNTYLLAIKEKEVIGMIALHDQRPFSLDKKLGDIYDYLPIKPKNLCEVRLLSIKKKYRKSNVFKGLMQLLYRFCISKEYDAAVISGTTRELMLYQHLGFMPFAHYVGKKDALYQPMYITTDKFGENKSIIDKNITFLPGPLSISPNLQNKLPKDVVSHRDEIFINKMDNVQKKLTNLAGSKYVQILVGTGTLANDAVAAQLSLLHEKGLILSNGEFGDRLIDRANRFQLNYITLKKPWGEVFSKEEIIQSLDETIKWVWYVHCETSTGVINSIELLSECSIPFSIKQVVDCISSIGAMPITLENIYLATGVSGKGIGSISGLSFVFHNHKISPSRSIPSYLDLGEYYLNSSVPYTHSSYLLFALEEALNENFLNKFQQIASLYYYAYKRLKEKGFSVLVEMRSSAFSIITICVNEKISSLELGNIVKMQGYTLHYQSRYLVSRNWLQIATIGNINKQNMESMINTLFNTYKYLYDTNQKYQTTKLP